MHKYITQAHGDGGLLTQELINNIFLRFFHNPILQRCGDSAVFQIGEYHFAITTDSFVIDPIFFAGGNIGKLSVCGTINDLAVSGAKPLFLTAAFIIEEHFPIQDLELIVKSMSEEASEADVKFIAGDTKVVGHGQCDKIFINTTGIGIVSNDRLNLNTGELIENGDAVLINGTIGDHGMSIMIKRNFENLWIPVISDCASLNQMIESLFSAGVRIKFMRDVTRGGLATILNEIVKGKAFGIDLFESSIPINEAVRGACEILGFDPLYVANEGKVVIIVDKENADKALEILRKDKYGHQSQLIGYTNNKIPQTVLMHTLAGGKRILEILADVQLPRIC